MLSPIVFSRSYEYAGSNRSPRQSPGLQKQLNLCFTLSQPPHQEVQYRTCNALNDRQRHFQTCNSPTHAFESTSDHYAKKCNTTACEILAVPHLSPKTVTRCSAFKQLNCEVQASPQIQIPSLLTSPSLLTHHDPFRYDV